MCRGVEGDVFTEGVEGDVCAGGVEGDVCAGVGVLRGVCPGGVEGDVFTEVVEGDVFTEGVEGVCAYLWLCAEGAVGEVYIVMCVRWGC